MKNFNNYSSYLWFKPQWTQVRFLRDLDKPWNYNGNGGDICPKAILEKYGTENIFLVKRKFEKSKNGYCKVIFVNLTLEGNCIFEYLVLESLLEIK